MRRLLVILILLVAAVPTRGATDLSRVLTMISAVESKRPTDVGRAGERSRYQMLYCIWRMYTDAPFRRASSDEVMAARIAHLHLQFLAASLRERGITVTSHSLALAWTAGLDGMQHPTRDKLDYADRVARLYDAR